ncbi:MAG: hypothetical protein FWE72_00210 [Spirochaetaceae bacterium]|nr:hypothetical protein [Spirochaetaceae bacterium]
MKRKISLIYFIMILLLIAVLISCASTPKSTSIQVANAVEVMGINWAQYQGRVLKIESIGNSSTDITTVRENALIRATWETYQLGFDYFMILSENGSATRNTYTTSGSATTIGTYTYINPGTIYNTTSHSLIIIIFCCFENELFNDVPTFSVSSRLAQARQFFKKPRE